MADHAWVKNPETGGVWASPIDYLPVALARGWEPCDAPVEEEPEAPAPPPVSKKKRTTNQSGD